MRFPDDQYLLKSVSGVLSLIPLDKAKGGALFVDFNSEKLNRRRRTGGIKQELAKACGLKKDFKPKILDVTAGLGSDAFILAALGAKVVLLERNDSVYELLKDGFYRSQLLDNDVAKIVASNMYLVEQGDSLEQLHRIQVAEYDCIYCDPMFPERSKSAKVKKAMQYFHDVVGFDSDQEEILLDLAMEKAGKRVVVKRPKLAPFLAERKPSLQIKSKTLRYDIYLTP